MEDREDTECRIPETRNQLDLPVCEICSEKLAGYQIDLDGGKILRVCKDCCIDELTR